MGVDAGVVSVSVMCNLAVSLVSGGVIALSSVVQT